MLRHVPTIKCDKSITVVGLTRATVKLCSLEHEYLCPGCNGTMLSPSDFQETDARFPYCSACAPSALLL